MININSHFWTSRIKVLANEGIFHQWEMLESSGCIQNFRIAAGMQKGHHVGWFFADSDAYKWLDAAAGIYVWNASSDLASLMDEFIHLLKNAQSPDGYLYTYNQIQFPGSRWENLLIEHELYCHGHLIEACISYKNATGKQFGLEVAQRAADLIVGRFLHDNPRGTDGHPEIEIALLKLYKETGEVSYRDLAVSFLERRGKRVFLPFPLIQEYLRVEKRKRIAVQDRQKYRSQDPCTFFEGNYAKTPSNSRYRWLFSALSGRYFQMHASISKIRRPVGHSVRFGYLFTALALAHEYSKKPIMPSEGGLKREIATAERLWDRTITRHMYVTGGLGSVPGTEGFGRDYELDPEYAYAETCAALSNIFWSLGLAKLTKHAKYSDLIEWQLYNAALVGMSLDGKSYLYNNPLVCRQGITRRQWFAIPCCPSNLTRTLANLGSYTFFGEGSNIWINQYFGGSWRLQDTDANIEMHSELPWAGDVDLLINTKSSFKFTFHLRIPSWTDRALIQINNKVLFIRAHFPSENKVEPGSGYDPRDSYYVPVTRTWTDGDRIKLTFPLPLRSRTTSPHVKRHKGKITLTRGPIVFCLESIDNPAIDIFDAHLILPSLQTEYSPSFLGGTQIIRGMDRDNHELIFIPYFLWANRGASSMTVWTGIN
jgi:DUF1680 family protein